jgi:hypothetical protein
MGHTSLQCIGIDFRLSGMGEDKGISLAFIFFVGAVWQKYPNKNVISRV